MKKMKNHILPLLFIIAFISACSEDFLDRQSLTSLSSESFWNSESDAYLALMGCYDALQSNWMFDSYPWGGGVLRMDFMCDNGYTNWQWMSGAKIAQGIHTPTEWMVNELWNESYVAIVRCNLLISKINEVEGIDAAVVKRMVAEAKVIRSTVYNLLSLTYKDVPLITEPQAMEDSNVPKVDQQVIVDFMINDMNAAINDLPETVPGKEWGRITKGAAMAMLTRIYLWHGYYTEAAEMAQSVINSGQYSLFHDYSTLFTVENEVNDEVIFTVAFDRILDDGSSFAGYWGESTITYQRPLPNLVNEFYCTDGLPIDQSPLYNPDRISENRDPRFSVTIASNGDLWRGDTLKGQATEYMRKWTEEFNSENHYDSPQDFYVIRYADVLLMRAEALLLSGAYNETEVVALVNQVRDRVNMPKVEDVEGTGLSQEQLLDIVKHERRVELAFEGVRYLELMGLGELKEVYDEYMNTEVQILKDRGYPGVRDRVFEDPKHWKWPIPQGELDNNSALEQHPGW